jgi:lysophospholipase L1-like esterase
MIRDKIFHRVLFLSTLLVLLTIVGCRKCEESLTIVCLGDSLTLCGGPDGKYSDWLARWLPDDTIINKGLEGDTLAGGRSRFQRDVLDLHPDIVVIALGANDFWQANRQIPQLKADLEDMILRAKSAGIQVIIASTFGARDYVSEKRPEFGPERFDFAYGIAQMEKQLTTEHNCTYVPNMQTDIKPDGRVPYWQDYLHPNEIGNEFVAKRILEAIKIIKKERKT